MVDQWLTSSSGNSVPGYESLGTRSQVKAEVVAPATSSSFSDVDDGGDGRFALGAGRGCGCGEAAGVGRHSVTTTTAGLFVWATAASLAAALLAVGRGGAFEDSGHSPRGTREASSAASFESTVAVGGAAAAAPSPQNAWCLPNAAHQRFSGVVLKEDDGVMPAGEWEGQHWWYHDEITSGFHMLVTIGGDTYGFWDLGIISAAGNTEYVAAYKGDECLFYEEKVRPGSTPFDKDLTCRGSAWAGNVTLKEEVEFGYGTKAERWTGTILGDHDTGYGGLPPGTESLVDLQRNPENSGEVRLLYHRVVAPTKGVLEWATGESLSFDLVFTGVQSMASSDVLDLVKVPSICEVMAGEFHDQQARGKAGGGSGGTRALRRASSAAAAAVGNTNSGVHAGDSDVNGGSTPTLGPGGTGKTLDGEHGGAPRGNGKEERMTRGLGRSGSSSSSSSSGSRNVARDSGSVYSAGDAAAASPDDAPATGATKDVRGNLGEGGAEPTPAEASPGLLPIHQLMSILSPNGYRRRG